MLKFAYSGKYRKDKQIIDDEFEDGDSNRSTTELPVTLASNFSENTLEDLYFRFTDLKTACDDFESFLQVVSEDLSVKIETLKKLKSTEQAGVANRTDANLKVFMLTQYSSRVSRFRGVSASSLLSMSRKLERGEDVTTLVTKHLSVLEKMKRRMKHMLDVAEKYQVQDILQTIEFMRKLSDKLEESTSISLSPQRKRTRRISRSMTNLLSESMDDSSSTLTSDKNSLMPELRTRAGDLFHAKRRNPLKTFTELVVVLTKSFTSRK